MENKFTSKKSTAELKQEVRKKFTEVRHQIKESEIQTKNHAIADKIVNQPFFKTSNTIAAYYPYPKEASPLPILDIALQENKKCYLPRIISYKNRTLEFFSYQIGDVLEKNNLGIFEPKLDIDNKLNLDDLDLLIVPCLAFDLNNYRIGFGAGFYDRLISSIKKNNSNNEIKIIGIAFSEQRIDKLPIEDFDMKLDYIFVD